MTNGRKRRERAHGLFRQNAWFFYLLLVYVILLLASSVIACSFSYRQKAEELASQSEQITSALAREYKDVSNSFWKLYMPMFEQRNSIYAVINQYFSRDHATELSQFEKSDLSYALTQMLLRDERVEWIVVYSEHRDVNYLFVNEGRKLTVLTADFPYLTALQQGASGMTVHGKATLQNPALSNETFAISGGVPSAMGDGIIMAGYKTSSFSRICNGYQFLLDSMRYYLVSDGETVFDTGDGAPPYLPEGAFTGEIRDTGGRYLRVEADTCGSITSYLVYTAALDEVSAYRHRDTLSILLLVIGFAALSVLVYGLILRVVTREVNVIRSGLRRIGDNDMQTPIPTTFVQGGLQSIAESINDMAKRLDENIKRAHDYELRQKEAELSELQSKFNPHFLYNTLEMLRSRSLNAGSDEVAGLIADFAAIFRGYIGSSAFVPFREELAATRRYLSLLGARYDEQVDIRFDIGGELLQYGIIRGVLQPLIENYFQYGFDTTENDNYILIEGRSIDEKTFLLGVSDNGSGMTDEALAQLREKIDQPIEKPSESYGLKNLNQRLKLFYGNDCGLRLAHNGARGLRVEMMIRKMTCEEYSRKSERPAGTEQ